MNKEKVLKAMPTVLFITGIAGIFVSEILTVRATVKAKDILAKERSVVLRGEEDNVITQTHVNDNGFKESQLIVVCDTKEELIKETIKSTWKCYIPPLVSTSLTLASLIASNHLNRKQIALLTSAFASATSLVAGYRREILERTDEEMLREIDTAVAEAELKNHKDVYINTSHWVTTESFDANEDGEYIFFDPLTKQKFRSTKLLCTSARYFLNRNFALAGLVSLETFYNFLGVDLPEEYRYMEWDMDKIIQDGDELPWIDIDFVRSTSPDPDTGEYYYIIEYNYDPGEIEGGPFLYPFGNPLEEEGSFVRN